MIYSSLDKLIQYIPEKLQLQFQRLLNDISGEDEELKVFFDDEETYIQVMKYQTKEKHRCKLEAHDKYVDIQIVLKGCESISIYDRELFKQSNIVERKMESDVTFYQEEGFKEFAYVNLLPGFFTMIFPEEVHRPQQAINNNIFIKKMVIKINIKYFQ